MTKATTILPFDKPVKRLLTPAEKAFVSYLSKILVNKTLNDAKQKMHTVPAV